MSRNHHQVQSHRSDDDDDVKEQIQIKIEKEEEEQQCPQEQHHHDPNDNEKQRLPLTSTSPSPSPLTPVAKTETQSHHCHPKFEFVRQKHIQYFVHCLKRLPVQYKHLDTNRLTMVHFAVQSLDILQFFDDDNRNTNLMEQYNVCKEDIIAWIYSLQIVSPSFQFEFAKRRKRQKLKTNSNLVGKDCNSNHVDIGEDDNEEDNKNVDNVNGTSASTTDEHDPNHDHTCDNDNTKSDSSRKTDSNAEWLYWKHAGFKGGTFLPTVQNTTTTPDNGNNENNRTNYYNQGHIAMTYTALCTLLTLGDNLQQIDKQSITSAISTLQNPIDGSFQCRPSGSECDLRFVYCACAISYLLDDWSGMNVKKAVEYIWSCRSYDGAFGLVKGMEGHGGSTFCAVASLVLMGVIDNNIGNNHDNDDDVIESPPPAWKDELIHWCVMRQIQGMQGRPNKREDTCYSYWIGGTLRLLGCDHLLDTEALKSFVLGCQCDYLGGFSKLEDGMYPDLLHSFYSLAWLSLSIDDDGYKSKSNKHRVKDSGDKNTSRNLDGEIFLNRLDCGLGMCRLHVENYFNIQKDDDGKSSATEALVVQGDIDQQNMK